MTDNRRRPLMFAVVGAFDESPCDIAQHVAAACLGLCLCVGERDGS